MNKNPLLLFCLTFSFYLPQGIFFVVMVSFFSSIEASLTELGNIFLLATIPFLLSSFFLVSKVDYYDLKTQLIIIKFIRSFILLLLGLSLILGLKTPISFYCTILFFDLGLFLYQGISGSIIKDIASNHLVRKMEAVHLLGVQLGMAASGLVVTFLISYLSFGLIIMLAGCIEMFGLLFVQNCQKNKHLSGNMSEGSQLRYSFHVYIKAIRHPKLLMTLFAFSLILPLQQLFSLIGGPWSHMRFNDNGQMLGWLIFGSSLGAAIGSMSMITFKRLCNSSYLSLSALFVAVSLIGIYYSLTLMNLLICCTLFGISFTFMRVVLKAGFIKEVPDAFSNAIMMLSTMTSVFLSIVSIVSIGYIFSPTVFQVFILMIILVILLFVSLHFIEPIPQEIRGKQYGLFLFTKSYSYGAFGCKILVTCSAPRFLHHLVARLLKSFINAPKAHEVALKNPRL